ncbi:hypothetical protein RP726_16830 [Candidatus Methylospira mobilis]|nr:hypothetical protein [Candidatus Methylospira mobilis]WNV04066.1 hypothetical protein RP726_16830 [Candidatus Methylospira mobilis]
MSELKTIEATAAYVGARLDEVIAEIKKANSKVVTAKIAVESAIKIFTPP